jgi:hypothetical protein
MTSFKQAAAISDALMRLQQVERELIAQKHQIEDLSRLLLNLANQGKSTNGTKQPDRRPAAVGH